ncbi:putative ankyrin repeat-containing protein [Trichoderma pleuroticola]
MSDPDNYTIGWISAIEIEYTAAQAFLDERHDGPKQVKGKDNNSYTLGRIGNHNVVMTVLPRGDNGVVAAALAVNNMMHTFPNVRVCLMVGIAGGVPSKRHDIRLGDVVVSIPTFSEKSGNLGGVVQYDYARTMQTRRFQGARYMNQPDKALRNAANGLSAKYIDTLIDDILEENENLRKKYSRPHPDSDILYSSDPAPEPIERPERSEEEDNPAVHYGLIASADSFMEDAQIRDLLAAELDVLCFEMEAAGLMNDFPCLVIRGICDYSDKHWFKQWRGYAAMTAAAYAKILLEIVPVREVDTMQKIHESELLQLKKKMEALELQAKEADKRDKAWAKHRKTPLHLAASEGNVNVVQKLLNQGDDIEAKDKYGGTPFFDAVYSGKKDTAKLLLDRGADINVTRNDGWPIFHEMVVKGRADMVTFLLDHGANIEAKRTEDETPLGLAIGVKNPDMAKLLLARGADIEAQDDAGWTELHTTASKGEIDMVKLLLDHGANIEAKTKSGHTPLFLAINQRETDVAELLLDWEADIDAQDVDGDTILHDMASGGKIDMVKFLLDHDADIESKGNDGNRPFCSAVWNEKYKVANLLLSRGADIEAKQNKDGFTIWSIIFLIMELILKPSHIMVVHQVTGHFLKENQTCSNC